MKRLFFWGCMILAAVNADAVTVDSLLGEVDNRTEITTDAQANVTLTQQKTNQGTKTIEMVWYRRDSDDAFMIVMIAPESEKGNGYLRMGENFWMYRKNTRTFQHVNRDENIGGSDAQADDFEKRKLTELYAPAIDKDGKEALAEEMLGNIAVYRFEVRAKVNDVDYPKKIYWIRKDNCLVLKEQSFALSGSLMQTAYYLKYSLVDKSYVPVKMMFVDEFEKGNKTIVEISGISTKALDDKLFTKAYLENLSK